MKTIFLILFTMITSTAVIAETEHSKTSATKLAQAWKNANSQVAELQPNDLLMVYGGEDISLKQPPDNPTHAG